MKEEEAVLSFVNNIYEILLYLHSFRNEDDFQFFIRNTTNFFTSFKSVYSDDILRNNLECHAKSKMKEKF